MVHGASPFKDNSSKWGTLLTKHTWHVVNSEPQLREVHWFSLKVAQLHAEHPASPENGIGDAATRRQWAARNKGEGSLSDMMGRIRRGKDRGERRKNWQRETHARPTAGHDRRPRARAIYQFTMEAQRKRSLDFLCGRFNGCNFCGRPQTQHGIRNRQRSRNDDLRSRSNRIA